MTKTATDALTKDRAMRSFVFRARVIWWLLFCVVSAYALALVAIAFDGLAENIRPSDVAVILGSKVELSGRPSARLRARLDRGAALYKTGTAKWLIVSGGVEPAGQNEALVMRDYLTTLGVPAQRIILDAAGNNTEATAKNCAAIMKSHGFKSLILVTQYFHVSRTRVALNRYGIQGVHSAYARYFELRDVFSLTREAVALPVYWLRGARNS